MKKKSQSSMEFLFIFGIAFTFILILGGVFFSFSTSSQNNLNSQQIEKIGEDIMSNIERVYFRGPGNKIQYKATFPDDIQNMSLHYKVNSTINFTYLNITQVSQNQIVSHIFLPANSGNNYINFLCKNCTNTTAFNPNNNFTQNFYPEDYSGGPKTIAIRSLQKRVKIDYVK